MTTKEQERKAIEKIRKIVEDLGTTSYVGTAMEGVLEVAEQNIEYDAAYSLKAEKELAVQKEAQYRKEAESLQEQLKEAKQNIEELQERAREAEQLAKKRYMMPHVYERLYEILEEKGREADRRMREAAAMMADSVGKDNVSPNIYNAAEEYRQYRAEMADSVMLQQEIRRYKEDE